MEHVKLLVTAINNAAQILPANHAYRLVTNEVQGLEGCE